ncbi:MAG: hypothetical protein ACOVQN_00540 [Exiguobacterium sp.]
MAASPPPSFYEWAKQVAHTNDLVQRVSDEKASELLWADRYEKPQPAVIGHSKYGPCLIHAERQVLNKFTGFSRSYYLVTLVTALPDPELRRARSGYFQMPRLVSVVSKSDTNQVMTFVFPVKQLITKFILADGKESGAVADKESSILEVYDGERYTQMTLGEMRARIDDERSTEYKIAFDIFKQSNTSFLARHNISAPTVVTPEADMRLITSKVGDVSWSNALAPDSLRRSLDEKDSRKGQSQIDARNAVPLHDSHGIIRHLSRQ